MEKKSPYRRCFSFGCSDNPRRKNSKIHVWFFGFMCCQWL
jgi:hypothetical protein